MIGLHITHASPPCAIKNRCHIGERNNRGIRYHRPFVAKILYILTKIGFCQKTLLISDKRGKKFYLNRKSLVKWIKNNRGKDISAFAKDSVLLRALRKPLPIQNSTPKAPRPPLMRKPLIFPSLPEYCHIWVDRNDLEEERTELLNHGLPSHYFKVHPFGLISFQLNKSAIKGFLGHGVRIYPSTPLRKPKILLDEAEKAISGDHVQTNRVTWNLPEKRGFYQDMIASLLKEHRGICTGEMHEDIQPKRFLIDHMQLLRELGVDTLFMEFLLYDKMQSFLDEYFHAPKESKLPLFLETYLDNLTEEHTLWFPWPKGAKEQYGYKAIVERAKKAGIRVVGIDTNLSMEAGYRRIGGAGGRDRQLAMNYVANRVIQHEQGKGKFVAFMGSSHGSATKDSITKAHPKPVPGVAELLNVPFVVVEGGHPLPNKTNRVQANVKGYAKGEVDFVTLVIKGYTGQGNYTMESAEN